MKKIVYFIFVFLAFIFISSTVFSYSYSDSKYKDRKPLMDKNYSREIGFNLAWLRSCGEGSSVTKLRNQIKELSYADYKKTNLGYGDFQTGNKYSIQCSQVPQTIISINSYINTLDTRISSKISISKQSKKEGTKNKFITKKKELIYCKDSDGVFKYIADSISTNNTCYDGQVEITEEEYNRLQNNNSSTYITKKSDDIKFCKRYDGMVFQSKYTCENMQEISRLEYDMRIEENKNRKKTSIKYCKTQNDEPYEIKKGNCKKGDMWITSFHYNKLIKQQNTNKYITKKSKSENNVEGIYYTLKNTNIRSSPNSKKETKILITAPAGSKIEVIGKTLFGENWVQVKYENYYGYVYFPLLSKTFQTPQKSKNEIINEEFQIAMDRLRNQKYDEALILFNNYIAKYLNDQTVDTVGDAYYWLAEIYYMKEDYRKAALNYAYVYKSYPNISKAPNSLFKLSLSLIKLNKNDEACKTLILFVKNFPDNKLKESVLTTAEDIDCETLNISSMLKDLRNENVDIEDNDNSDQITIDLESLKNEKEGDNETINTVDFSLIIEKLLRELKELIDLNLITQDIYENRKLIILDQIINTNIPNRAYFLLKLVEQNLINEKDLKYIFNELSLNETQDKKIELKKIDNNAKENFELLSISEIDLVLQQLSRCFIAPIGVNIEPSMYVRISAKIQRNRRVVENSIRIVDTNIPKSNPIYGPVTESAMRTLLNPECSPLKLSEDKYEVWKNLTMKFDYIMMKGN